MKEKILAWDEFLTLLPVDPAEEAINEAWRAALARLPGKIVVLDDDPTGVQTVHGIPVYTRWERPTLARLFEDDARLVYILTNSRALTAAQTADLHRRLAADLVRTAEELRCDFLLVSRSDSTLRGHYPLETEILAAELGRKVPIHGEIVAPFFLEGGRFTFNDVHYVREGDHLVPAGQTEFAHDPVFGYRSSDLKKWIEEKTGGRYPAEKVKSIPLVMLRAQDLPEIVALLKEVEGFGKIVLNAVSYTDLKVFTIALAEVLAAGKRFLFRTAASFVRVVGGIDPKPLLGPKDLYPAGRPEGPGLILVGSYVRKTTAQLEALRSLPDLVWIEWNVAQAAEEAGVEAETARAVAKVEAAFATGRDACVYTSRDYRGTAQGGEADLLFAQRISKGLVDIVRRLRTRPGFILAKGGITSSDIGVKGLEVERAMVLGQIRPGVPVWRLGPESRFPGLPYVIFPGNVGDETTLREVVTVLRGKGGPAGNP
ncbi:MAG: hydroxyacid dehydrogenase [Firmicutes bacterium]|nr:hydroxyacid dehydrogenase [Bacillota bacterium]